MGQKTHPIGLRVGFWQRKWNNSWYTSSQAYSKIFFAQHRVNEMLSNFFYSYTMTKKMFTNRALLVNTRFIKSNITKGLLFIFFYKLRPKKIRRVFKLKKVYKNTFFKKNIPFKKKYVKQENSKNVHTKKVFTNTTSIDKSKIDPKVVFASKLSENKFDSTKQTLEIKSSILTNAKISQNLIKHTTTPILKIAPKTINSLQTSKPMQNNKLIQNNKPILATQPKTFNLTAWETVAQIIKAEDNIDYYPKDTQQTTFNKVESKNIKKDFTNTLNQKKQHLLNKEVKKTK